VKWIDRREPCLRCCNQPCYGPQVVRVTIWTVLAEVRIDTVPSISNTSVIDGVMAASTALDAIESIKQDPSSAAVRSEQARLRNQGLSKRGK